MPEPIKPVTKRYYPALSEVITVDDLPEFLHFAEEGLNLLLGKIYYKTLQFSKSYCGDAAFYSRDIIAKFQKIEVIYNDPLTSAKRIIKDIDDFRKNIKLSYSTENVIKIDPIVLGTTRSSLLKSSYQTIKTKIINP